MIDVRIGHIIAGNDCSAVTLRLFPGAATCQAGKMAALENPVQLRIFSTPDPVIACRFKDRDACLSAQKPIPANLEYCALMRSVPWRQTGYAAADLLAKPSLVWSREKGRFPAGKRPSRRW